MEGHANSTVINDRQADHNKLHNEGQTNSRCSHDHVVNSVPDLARPQLSRDLHVSPQRLIITHCVHGVSWTYTDLLARWPRPLYFSCSSTPSNMWPGNETGSTCTCIEQYKHVLQARGKDPKALLAKCVSHLYHNWNTWNIYIIQYNKYGIRPTCYMYTL